MSETSDMIKIIENVIDNVMSEDLVCPYCGAKQYDTWEFDEGDGTTFCEECDREFKFNKELRVKFNSTKLEDDD